MRDGWAVLIVCPFTLESELVSLIRAGYKIIGQRWTVLREEDGRLALMHLPGAVERSFIPRLRAATTATTDSTWSSGAIDPEGSWVDLSAEYLGSWQNHAFCDAVLVAEGGRRGLGAHPRRSTRANAINVLRRAWPIVELHPQRRWGHLPLKLAQHTARVRASTLSQCQRFGRPPRNAPLDATGPDAQRHRARPLYHPLGRPPSGFPASPLNSQLAPGLPAVFVPHDINRKTAGKPAAN